MTNQNLKLTFKRITICLLILAGLALISNLPTKTKQGIDGVVTVRTIPLYVKACGFLYRDYQYKSLSRRIMRGITADRERVKALYGWTVENIRKVPPDFPIVDDHPWNIAIMGYGTRGQMADVFTTLASYAEYESFYDKLKISKTSPSLILSFVKIDGVWGIFDIYNKEYFISEKDKSRPTPYGPTYGEYLKTMDKAVFKPSMRRPDKQKVIPRFVYEFKKVFVGKHAKEK